MTQPIERTTTNQEPTESLDQSLTFRLSETSLELNKVSSSILKSVCGLGLNEWRVLRVVASGNATTNAELAAFISSDKSIISRSMGSLESRGLIRLSRNKTDRRKLDIAVTPKGQRIHAKTLPHMEARKRYLSSHLDENELASLGAILDKIKQAALNWDMQAANTQQEQEHEHEHEQEKI